MIRKNLLKIILLTLLLLSITSKASAYENKALILYDVAGDFYNSRLAHQQNLANLLGHFDLPYQYEPIDQYKQGDISNYRATFYVGNYWDSYSVPWWFMDDIFKTERPVIWINWNLWRMAWSDYQQLFENRYKIKYVTTEPTGNFNKVLFKGRTFSRIQDNFANIQILDSNIVKTKAYITDGQTNYPYIVKSGNLYFVADNPLDMWTEDQDYIVFAELLHEMVSITHSTNRRALVRLEDINPLSDPAAIKNIANTLANNGVPFSIGVIPRFTDPLGAYGPPMTVDLKERPALVSALQYAISKGGTLVVHGFTHQYDSIPNPYNGVTAEDSEFLRVQLDSNGNPKVIGPVPEDSAEWVQGRINSARTIFAEASLPIPTVWESPHYHASELDHSVIGTNFNKTYERFGNTYFPYVINRSIFNNKIIPENLGMVDPLPWTEILRRADRNLVVTDGFASFFIHSDINLTDLRKLIRNIKHKGYTFVGINGL